MTTMLKYPLDWGVQDVLAGEVFRPRAVGWQGDGLVLWAESEKGGTVPHRVAVVMTGEAVPDDGEYIWTAATVMADRHDPGIGRHWMVVHVYVLRETHP